MNQAVTLLLAIVTAAVGNLLLKGGMLRIGKLTFLGENIITEIVKIFTNPFILIGLSFYVTGFFFWLKVLSTEDLSRVYPILVSSAITAILIGSSIFFKETISFTRLVGVIVIILGIYLVFKS